MRHLSRRDKIPHLKCTQEGKFCRMSSELKETNILTRQAHTLSNSAQAFRHNHCETFTVTPNSKLLEDFSAKEIPVIDLSMLHRSRNPPD